MKDLHLTLGRAFSVLLMAALGASAATPTVNLSLELVKSQYSVRDPFYHGQLYYYAFPHLEGTSQPITQDRIISPTGAYNFTFDGTGTSGGVLLTGDFADFLDKLTNGPWTLILNEGDPSVQTNQFHVSISNLNGTTYPAVAITSPADNDSNVVISPPFTWSGPTSFQSLLLQEYTAGFSNESFASVDPATTSWTNVPPLSLDEHTFQVTYGANGAAFLSFSVPTNIQSHAPLSGWSPSSTLTDQAYSTFTVHPLPILTGHTLLAYFNFDDTNNPGIDVTGHGYDLRIGGGYNGGGVDPDTNAEAGAGCLHFHNNNGVGGGFQGWYPNTPQGLLTTMAGSFSISVWVKTSSSLGEPTDLAVSGEGIITADVPSVTNDVTPLSITGGLASFNTGGAQDQTLHSTTAITNGVYHHVVVTRNQYTGEKDIYIDGVLDGSTNDTSISLNAPNLITIGSMVDAGALDPRFASYYNGFDGFMDDLQIYAGALTSNDVQILFQNPGFSLPDVVITAPMLQAHYTFDNQFEPFLDSSGNHNDLSLSGSLLTGSFTTTNNSVAGGRAGSFPLGAYVGYYPKTPAGLLSTLANSYTISLWLKTTQTFATDFSPANDGAGIVWADVAGGANDSIPMALTGSKLGFMTGGDYDDTVNSIGTINTGTYTHVVVVRDRVQGEKKVYINGALDTDAFSGAQNYLIDSPSLVFGANIVDNRPFTGLIDDIQIYSGILDDSQVAYLYLHPGQTSPKSTVLDVTILDPKTVGSNFQFSFLSINGYEHQVEYTDDLNSGNWQFVDLIIGDGTKKTESIPVGATKRFFRVITFPNQPI